MRHFYLITFATRFAMIFYIVNDTILTNLFLFSTNHTFLDCLVYIQICIKYQYIKTDRTIRL